ncbi:efflux transporter outer membrane subunit [Mesorhizobium sp. B2-3-3]|nr:efflux transporter outer membrane subunit [Mesorhizobium sp. B2-3-3]
MRHPFIAASAACFLAGCTSVGPDYTKPDLSLATNYAEPAGKSRPVGPGTRWWEGLADPILDDLIAQAQRSNLTVAQAIERVGEARANAKATGAEGFPELDASGSFERKKTDSGSATTTASGELAASWEIDLFGKYRRSRESALATLEATGEDLKAARLTLLGDVATDYVQMRGYSRRLEVARRELEAKRQVLRITRANLRVGNATTLEVSEAEGSAAKTEANIPSLETSLQASMNALATLLDIPFLTVRAQLATGGDAVPMPRHSVGSGVPADLLRYRPDVRAAERSLAAAVADIGVAEADLYPSLTLSGSLNVSVERIAGVSNGSTGWALGPSLDVPVFNAGRLRALVDVERSQANRQYFAYRQTVMNAVEEVENALVSFSRAKRRRAALEKSVAAYRQAVDQSRELYESGVIDFLNFLDAQDDLYSAQDTLVQSEVAIATDYITLCKALGGGWTASPAPKARKPDVDHPKPQI